MMNIEMKNAAVDSALIDVRNHGVINKQTSISVAGHDVVTMPRKAAASAGNGIMTGVGMAVASAGIGLTVAGIKAGVCVVGGAVGGAGQKLRGFKKRPTQNRSQEGGAK